MSTSINLYNIVMSVTNKFIKRITLILEKNTYKAKNWATALIERFEIVDWNYLKIIIFDRNRKFLSKLWKAIFDKFNVRLLYSTSYHSQTNDSSERTNQTTKITLRFYIHDLKNAVDWSQCFSIFQILINNSMSVTIEKSSNEVIYEFILNTFTNLLKFDIVNLINLFKSRIEVRDVIIWTSINYKKHYDRRHTFLFLKQDDWVLLKFYHDYSIFSSLKIIKKSNQQFVDLFKVLIKIKRLTYKLNISDHWKVHFVFFVTQLESFSSSNSDSYNRSRSDHFDSIFVENDIDDSKLYEIDRFLDKRIVRKNREQSTKYLIKWKKYDSEWDSWYNMKDLKNVENLIKDYEQAVRLI